MPSLNTGGVAEVFGQALRIVPFNDLGAVERVLAEDGERIAGMILEPVPMNAGVIPPSRATSRASPTCCTGMGRCSRSTR